jgi:uncharacterized protein YjbJ (UPF0337 family)
MNKDIIQGRWKELKGEVQTRWGRLTDGDLDEINGERTKLLGRLQATYGIAKDEAEKQVKEWEDRWAA